MAHKPKVTSVSTDRAPAPAGHYSQGVIAGDYIYISGQLPIRADGEKLDTADFGSQAVQAIDNMLAILAEAGGRQHDLVKVTAYIVGVSNWPQFNAVYSGLLPDVRPARTVVPVPELHYGFLVEIDAIALAPHLAQTKA